MEHENLNKAKNTQLGIGDVMPSSCLFQGQRRAIVKETKHFYFFACGTIFQWDYAEKQLCSDVRQNWA